MTNLRKISDLAFDAQQEMFDKISEIISLATELEIERIYEFQGEVAE